MRVLALVLLSASAAVASDENRVARGRELYEGYRCQFCHSVAGKGNRNGPHDGVGSRLSAQEMRDWIRKPSEMARKAKSTRKPAMPAFPSLSDQELDALVAYLQTLKKE